MEEMRLDLGCMGSGDQLGETGESIRDGRNSKRVEGSGWKRARGSMDWGSQAGSAQGNLEGEAEAYCGGLWMWRMKPEFPVYLR